MNRLLPVLMLLLSQIAMAQPDLNFNQIHNVPSLVTIIENAGDNSDRLFFGTRSGRVYVRKNGMIDTDNPFLDISGIPDFSTGGERGLLGMAFHPNFSNNGFFYINYTVGDAECDSPDYNNDALLRTVIARYSVDPQDADRADENSQQILLTYCQLFSNHNGGDITFGPDGYLYISSGDGGSGGDPDDNGQKEDQLLGKILRVDVDGTTANSSNLCGTTGTANYAIPPTNPFVGNDGQCDEIYATGLRNPWRISFDNAGDLWIADVGQNAFEEISIYPATAAGGLNFGWDCLEGFSTYGNSSADCSNDPTNDPTYVDPVYAYSHNGDGASITGGFLYEGSQIPDLQGYYLFSDLSDITFSALKKTSAVAGNPQVRQYDNFPQVGITTFGEDEAGEIYFGDFSGNIYQISGTALPLELVRFTATPNQQQNIELQWQVAEVEAVSYFEMERSSDGKNFTSLATTNWESAKRMYRYTDTKPFPTTNFYRLKIVNEDGSFNYSKVINVALATDNQFTIVPNPNRGQFRIEFNQQVSGMGVIQINIIDNLGKVVKQYPAAESVFPYQKDVNLSGVLPAGIYTVEVTVDKDVYREQVIIE